MISYEYIYIVIVIGILKLREVVNHSLVAMYAISRFDVF